MLVTGTLTDFVKNEKKTELLMALQKNSFLFKSAAI